MSFRESPILHWPVSPDMWPGTKEQYLELAEQHIVRVSDSNDLIGGIQADIHIGSEDNREGPHVPQSGPCRGGRYTLCSSRDHLDKGDISRSSSGNPGAGSRYTTGSCASDTSGLVSSMNPKALPSSRGRYKLAY